VGVGTQWGLTSPGEQAKCKEVRLVGSCGELSFTRSLKPGGEKTRTLAFPVETYQVTVLSIRIRRIRMFSGLLDPDPVVRGMDRDPSSSIVKQK
jgi:hypothetical protein